MQQPLVRRLVAWRVVALGLPVLLCLALISPLGAAGVASETSATTRTFTNPLRPQIPGDGIVESCADPSIIRAADGDWYIYCTTDPLNGADRTDGNLNFHKIPILRSSDLVNWTYEGDAFTNANLPSWAESSAGFWAPEIRYVDGTYYLYYGVTDTKQSLSGVAGCDSDNAIGVATSTSPTGPWTAVNTPVIAPRANDPDPNDTTIPCNFFWTYDPEVITDDSGQSYIYYGSYYGGVFVRELSEDYLSSDPESAVQITIANRYEGAEVIEYQDYYYLFVSAANCCNGPITGYSVFAGRSTSPLGPFVDREGVSLMSGRVGGTPVISMNGNRWVGPGHNSVFQDAAGEYWTVYHAIDRFDPFYAGAPGFTKRPVLLDRLDWVDGWPMVRSGLWASDTPQPAPAIEPDESSDYQAQMPREDVRGRLLPAFSDEFNGPNLSAQWSWVRQPADAATYGQAAGVFRFNTQAGDLFVDSNTASVLTQPTPAGDYMVETKVDLNLPEEGCCFNYVQAGLVIYGSDDAFIKLVHASIWETRQTEFAKEVPPPVPANSPRYGNTVVGPPNFTTWLRIVKRTQGNEETYTAYTSRDGRTFVRGGTWTHNLGSEAKIGLVSMGGTGFTAEFDYVRVYGVQKFTYLPMIPR